VREIKQIQHCVGCTRGQDGTILPAQDYAHYKSIIIIIVAFKKNFPEAVAGCTK